MILKSRFFFMKALIYCWKEPLILNLIAIKEIFKLIIFYIKFKKIKSTFHQTIYKETISIHEFLWDNL
jgi:hypothetical protein